MSKFDFFNIVAIIVILIFFYLDIAVKNEVVETNISLQKSIEDNTKIYKQLHTILDSNHTVFEVAR